MPIVTLPDIDDTANKRPKLSSDKFEPDISLSTSPASSDQGNSNDQDDKDDASDYEDASDNNSLNEKMEKLELPIDNDDETESVDLPSMGSL
jgi:hypothetical protein